MVIKELRLIHFGKFHNKTISLKEGINLIYGENEAGKSTIHSFIKGMLFGIEKQRGRASKEDTYLKYQPWDTPGAYSGSMDIIVDHKAYRMHRNFDKNSKSSTIIDIETGRELSKNPEEWKELYGGLTESGYRNTISIEQLKAKTDQELVEEVRNYLANLSLSKSNEVDVKRALTILQDKRKELEGLELDKKITSLKEEIQVCLQNESKIDELTLQLRDLEEREQFLQDYWEKTENHKDLNVKEKGFDSMTSYEEYLSYFPVIKEKYKSYIQDLSLIKSIQEKETKLQEDQNDIRSYANTHADIQKELEQIETINMKLSQYEQKLTNHRETWEKTKNENKRNMVIGFLVITICIFSLFFLLKHKSLFIPSVIGSMALGSMGLVLLVKRFKSKLGNLEKDYKNIENALKQMYLEKDTILYRNHVVSEQELKQQYQYYLKSQLSEEHIKKQMDDLKEQKDHLEDRILESEEGIRKYIRPLSDLFQKGDRSVIDINQNNFAILEDYVQKEKEVIRILKEAKKKEYEEIKLKKERLNWELKNLEGNEDTLLQKNQQLQVLEEQAKNNEVELSAIKLAIDTINALSIDIHDSFGGKLNETVSDIINAITNGRYSDIKVDEKMNIKVTQQDQYILSDKLSAGTICQLYLALRLSIADLVYGKGVMPILLDDCFALYDDKRTKAALEFLAENTAGQIIIFTCHTREKNILDRMQVNYHYVDLNS